MRRAPKRIRALFMDVDGVLTDGLLYIDEQGREQKVFDTKDGHGVKMALSAGLRVVWISGRTSKATALRARDLGVRFCYQGVADKKSTMPVLGSSRHVSIDTVVLLPEPFGPSKPRTSPRWTVK